MAKSFCENPKPGTERRLDLHVAQLLACRRCPAMQSTPVSGGAVRSRVILVGQAPGNKEPVLGRPFAWTAGRTLFGWFEQFCGLSQEQFRASIYMAAVCRCFPGKNVKGGDRVPSSDEIANCSYWLDREINLLRPTLVIPVGKLAIAQFLRCDALTGVIGKSFACSRVGRNFDVVPLPHPSGASPWHRIEPGRSLLAQAMGLIAEHHAIREMRDRLDAGL
jgi:uracil-DNA glycosylase